MEIESAGTQGGGDLSDYDSPDQPNLTRKGLARLLNVSEKWVVSNTPRIPGHNRPGRIHRYRRDEVIKAQLAGQILQPKPKVTSLGLKRRRG